MPSTRTCTVINKVGFIIIQMKNDPDALLDQVFRKDESLPLYRFSRVPQRLSSEYVWS